MVLGPSLSYTLSPHFSEVLHRSVAHIVAYGANEGSQRLGGYRDASWLGYLMQSATAEDDRLFLRDLYVCFGEHAGAFGDVGVETPESDPCAHVISAALQAKVEIDPGFKIRDVFEIPDEHGWFSSNQGMVRERGAFPLSFMAYLKPYELPASFKRAWRRLVGRDEAMNAGDRRKLVRIARSTESNEDDRFLHDLSYVGEIDKWAEPRFEEEARLFVRRANESGLRMERVRLRITHDRYGSSTGMWKEVDREGLHYLYWPKSDPFKRVESGRFGPAGVAVGWAFEIGDESAGDSDETRTSPAATSQAHPVIKRHGPAVEASFASPDMAFGAFVPTLVGRMQYLGGDGKRFEAGLGPSLHFFLYPNLPLGGIRIFSTLTANAVGDSESDDGMNLRGSAGLLLFAAYVQAGLALAGAGTERDSFRRPRVDFGLRVGF